ncbi:M36 family metallopeptidase [Solimonas flava]|uniref:M36 family metallopeptidase n=1 Tax=Solimonas flava TaxID=415849 RepID=UPI000424FCB8|nr:M36 family metallopeptidase [Solimonas flava]
MKRVILTGALLGAAAAASASGGQPANYDAFWAQQQKTAIAAALAGGAATADAAALGGASFVWAARDARAPVVGKIGKAARKAQLETFARQYLRKAAGRLALPASSVESATLLDLQDRGHGPVVARFAQRVGGIEVFNRRVSVMLDASGRPVAASGYFAASAAVKQAGAFAGSGGAPAVSAALRRLGVSVAGNDVRATQARGGYQSYALDVVPDGFALSRAPRSKAVYYALADRLVPAYYVEVFGRRAGAPGTVAWSFVFGEDGSTLFAKDLVAYEAAQPFTYRVFADAAGIHQPYDAPLGNGYLPFPGHAIDEVLPRVSATANAVTLVSGPISTGDPWLANDATTTTGNNADAFLDTGPQLGLPLNLPDPIGTITGDGYIPGSGDLRVALSGERSFDYPIHADDDPSTADAKNAAIVNLFYMNNWLHDWWYDHGFDEASGNAQNDNYGRGGVDGDAISAQGQDSSGRNNANMATPADGSSPTMQMYLFDGPLRGEVAITAPEPSAPLKFTGASFGPNTFDLSGDVVLAADIVGEPTDGCAGTLSLPITGTTIPAPPQPSLLGKIALIDRGNCSFTTKEQFATLSGAKAMIVVNNGDGDPITMGNADLPIPIGLSTDQLYLLPAVMIRKDDGQAIKDRLAAGQTVGMHLQRETSIDYDGTLDELVISHEYFHHVSNRLVNDGSGLSNTQGGGMGEGWSDVASLLLAVRSEDREVAGNERYQGAYPTGFYVIPSYYFGIRRAPYSTQMTVNPLTFKHIETGVAIEGAPIAFGADGADNAEVHNVGEVWANMLWEVYAALLNQHDFATAQARMKDYVIAGLKMTPSSPTFTEARDGVLAAALATDPADYALAARAFAKRGLGLHAVAPARSSTDNAGVVESYVAFAAPAPTLVAGIGATADGFDGCDGDGILDAGESARLSFALFNNGAYTPGETVTATVGSDAAGLSLGGGKLSFVAPAIGQSAYATLDVALAQGVASPLKIALTLALDAPASADPAVEYPPATSLELLANYDIARTANHDDFEYPSIAASGWTRVSQGTTTQWEIVDDNDELGSGHVWYAPDPETATDLYLVTPAFSVPAGGSFSVSFDHHYDFESLLPLPVIGLGYDGGFVEVSVDDGATWTDVTDFGASFTKNGYSGKAQVTGHRGFVNSNRGMKTSVLDFAQQLAGKTARLRFHVASDELNGGYGWAIDNLVLTGNSGAVFNAVSADDAQCTVTPPGGTTGGTTTGGTTTGGTTTGGSTTGGSTTGGTTTGGTTGGTTTGGTTTGGTTTGGTTGGTGTTTGGTTGGVSTGGTSDGNNGGAMPLSVLLGLLAAALGRRRARR